MISKAKREPSTGFLLARHLECLLTDLAEPLLAVGITPKQFMNLAASAFVRVASKASRLRNGRINQSRVAVLTGLSRPEVRKLTKKTARPSSFHQPRTARVLTGWLTDKSYSDKNGRPLKLPLYGRQASFRSLVRKYAGDVPSSAVLAELRQASAVHEKDGKLALAKRAMSPSSSALQSLALLFSIVSDGANAATSVSKNGAASSVRRLTLGAADTRAFAMMRERVATGTAAFLSGLEQSFGDTRRKGRAKKREKKITVTILMREQE